MHTCTIKLNEAQNEMCLHILHMNIYSKLLALYM